MKESENKKPWWEPGMVLFARLSVWIAGPIVAAVFFGKWLDEKYGTNPWLFLASVGLAFVLSSVGIVKEANEMIKKIVEDEKKKKENNNEKLKNGGEQQ